MCEMWVISNFCGRTRASPAWDVFIERGFVLLFPWACPARWCPFHPARQLGPDPSDLPLKRGFFQAPAGSSLSPPFSNIPFTPEITLFISRIIVSSWMRELCRHSSELNMSVGIGEGRAGCASGGWGVFHVLMSSFRVSRKTSRFTCSWPNCFAWQREREREDKRQKQHFAGCLVNTWQFLTKTKL